jgi:hypothetical protein
MVIMPVGHIKHNTAHRITQHFPGVNGSAVLIAVTGHLVHRDMGITLPKGLSVIVIVAQVDDSIGS